MDGAIESLPLSGARMAQRTGDGRTITATGLSRLLTRLDPDAERAALEYERLRRALIKFFDWRGGWPPEECADETLDRLARRLETETRIESVGGYAHGVARLVLFERRRERSIFTRDGTVELAGVPTKTSGDADEPLRDCFDRCLAELSDDGRAMATRYYEGEGQSKIANRRRLALALGLSENALRSRVQRIRERLERCVQSCVSES
jgi:DNA-directed RNA polymerase specialized sigma24 family protein